MFWQNYHLVWFFLDINFLLVHFLETEPRLPEQQSWHNQPDPIEESQIDPEIEPVAGIQVWASIEPVRAEGHPAPIQLTNTKRYLHKVPEMREQEVMLFILMRKTRWFGKWKLENIAHICGDGINISVWWGGDALQGEIRNKRQKKSNFSAALRWNYIKSVQT